MMVKHRTCVLVCFLSGICRDISIYISIVCVITQHWLQEPVVPEELRLLSIPVGGER